MRALRKSNSGLSPSFEAKKAFRGLDVRPSTGGRVQEENLHCGLVRDRRLALFNGPTREVSFKHRPLYPMNDGKGGL